MEDWERLSKSGGGARFFVFSQEGGSAAKIGTECFVYSRVESC
jgi:hypothetical protein